ncbi:hypothetical protein ADICYQ_4663 [Cyclobacterium qasimii M12-11B]|uniref:Uncharacterized protein n=1 Tax=Cyclobacterium qasimii M12-11B TaxID=641524 RepID=S7V8V8_9BACT|nr:hypothetical protein ADICYQ_4663 [Cyclobacterium qasimii M12-11B]
MFFLNQLVIVDTTLLQFPSKIEGEFNVYKGKTPDFRFPSSVYDFSLL